MPTLDTGRSKFQKIVEIRLHSPVIADFINFHECHLDCVMLLLLFNVQLILFLATIRLQCAITHLDDVIVSSSKEQHFKDVRVLSLPRDAGISFKFSKCHCFQESVKYLGYVVIEEGLAVDKEKTKAVEDLRPPSTRPELRRF
jgi:hypothetical protein